MNFIIGLLEFDQKNAICIVIDKLTRERHYIACIAINKGIFAKATTNILLHNVFKYYDLSILIISNRGPQFVIVVWNFFCCRLDITCKLSIAFHLKTNEQIERVNQDVERQLRTYCNYMQNNWFKWLLMTKFVDNNATFFETSMISFFANKNFYPRISFNLDNIAYTIARERIDVARTKNIIDTM